MACPTILDGDESDLTPLTDSDFSDSDDSDFQIEKPAPKRRRVSKLVEKEIVPKKRRGYKGALRDIWALPLDITYEILGHLHPLDLLHLARTNKALRRILMARTSMSIWLQARFNVLGVPDCPFDLSEPAYASLLFEPFCHYCSTNNVQTVIWEARIRCCKRCGPVMFQYWVNITGVPTIIQAIVPSTHEFSSGTIYPHTEKKYSVEIAVNLALEMEKVSEEDKPVWFWNQKKKFDKRLEHAAQCRVWVRDQHTRRGHELNEARLTRALQIIEKLGNLGWADEMSKMSSNLLTDHRHVKIPKELTERGWKKIEGNMVAFMEEVREKRLARERSRAMEQRCALMKEMHATFVASQPLYSILPGVADFATIPQLKAVLESPDLDKPVTIKDFQIGEEALVQFARQWREEKDNELLEILRQSSIGPAATKETLLRATTLFNCKTCTVPISYPRILVHACNFSRHSSGVPDPSTIFERLKSEPWNLGGDRISFHEAAHKRAQYILKALSLCPEITFEEMAKQNPFVECYCALCYRPSPTGITRSFTRWEHMIQHTPRYTSARISRPYGAVDERRINLAKKLELSELNRLRREPDWNDFSSRSYYCMHCKTRDTRTSIEHHIKAKHTIPHPAFDTDYTYHIDARIPLRAPFVHIKSSPKGTTKVAALPVASTSNSMDSSVDPVATSSTADTLQTTPSTDATATVTADTVNTATVP